MAPTDTTLDWQSLAVGSRERFFVAWLNIQVSQLEGVAKAVLLHLPAGASQLELGAAWPPSGADLAPLMQLVQPALEAQQPMIMAGPDGSGSKVLTWPVIRAERLQALVIVELHASAAAELDKQRHQLSWGVGRLEAFLARQAESGVGGLSDRLVATLEMIASALDHEDFLTAARALLTELAGRTGAARVSLGLRRANRIEVVAISHSASFAAEANVIRAIAEAMEEALDQHNSVIVPAMPGRDSAVIGRAGEALRKLTECGVVFTVPFMTSNDFAGALLAEFPPDKRPDTAMLALVETVVEISAPVLGLHDYADKSLFALLRRRSARFIETYTGEGHVLRKLITAGVVTFILLATFVQGDYRITADALLEGRTLRAAVAPFDGYISTASHRAGDVVPAGSEIARLEATDLELELSKWRAKREQLLRRYREARAAQNSTDMGIVAAQLEEADAEVKLLEQRVARTVITSPIEGVIVSGDLSQALGAPVQRGEVLFEIAPLDDYRVIIDVDERDIRSVRLGQTGALVLKSLPGVELLLEVKRVTPVAKAKEGLNAFEVEAEIVGDPENLLPGMEGVVKLDAGERSLAWIWTHRLVDWLRMQLWSWIP